VSTNSTQSIAQSPGTNRQDDKVASFIDSNVDKAMKAAGEKPVPDAPAVAPDANV
jgi:hypothetical protein